MKRKKLFWPNIRKTESGCWEWLGYRAKSGHGIFYYSGNPIKAHRYSWQERFGKIPKGLFVCHKCDNPPCINPEHLFLGDSKANNLDRHLKGRSKRLFTSSPNHPAKLRSGEKHWMAKLSDNDIRNIRKMRLEGKLQREIAFKYSVDDSTISRILRRKYREGVI